MMKIMAMATHWMKTAMMMQLASRGVSLRAALRVMRWGMPWMQTRMT